ncbi:MAG: cytochrome c biogenesis protein CcdA [bacterium]|nr:cytochrome c biogenesis protein CcdA [bacterium]
MDQPETISILFAFTAGVLSFVTPCVLPLFPSYLCFITGLCFEDFTGKRDRKVVRLSLIHSFLFVLGFSLVFIGLGASATLLGKVLFSYRNIIRIAGGILIIFFGIYVAGFFRVEALEKERRIRLERKPLGYLGSILVGSAFAAGWTPCIGPMLGSILVYAGTTGKVSTGIILLSSYSLGMALPFLICSWAFTSFLAGFDRIRRYLPAITMASGILLIIAGILVLTNCLGFINYFLGNLIN